MEVQAAKQWQRQIHANVIPLHLPICTEESTTFCKLNYISHIKPYYKKNTYKTIENHRIPVIKTHPITFSMVFAMVFAMVFIWFNHLLKHIHHSPNASCLAWWCQPATVLLDVSRRGIAHFCCNLQSRDELEVQVTWWMDMQYGMIYQFHTYYICVWKTYGWHLWSKWSKWRKWSEGSEASEVAQSTAAKLGVVYVWSGAWKNPAVISQLSHKALCFHQISFQKGKPWKTPCSSWCWSWWQSMFIISFLLVLNAGNFREWSIITSE